MKRISFVSLAIVLTLALSLITAPLTPVKAIPGIITVPDDYSTITEAVSKASDYDIIQVKPGTYNEENITVTIPLTIEGIGSSPKTLQGPGTGTSFGIYVHNTHDVTIRNLTIQGYRTGIFLHNSDNNTIATNISQNNTASGSINGCGIEAQGSDNNTITDNTFLNNEHGINLYNADLNYVVNNTSQHNVYGLFLKLSNNNTITGNDVSFNTSRGINLETSSQNQILGNTINDNDVHGIELFGGSTDNNTIENNDICNNEIHGISVNTRPKYNVITGNNICDNLGNGIWLFQDASYNKVYYNNIMNNKYGIFASAAHNCQIYNNNFINNLSNPYSKQAYAFSSGGIVFNLPEGGNYWSDWTTPDVDPVDGFVDNPYTIPGHPTPAYWVKDDLPWANPNGWLSSPPTSIQATIDIDPDTLNLNSKGKWITCYIELPEGYDVNDIDIDTILLEDLIQAEDSPTNVGDHDVDGIPDLMVKFDRQQMIDELEWDWGMVYTDELTITLNLNDGTAAEGSDNIKVLAKEDKGKGKGNK